MIFLKTLGDSIQNSHHSLMTFASLGIVAAASICARNEERLGNQNRRKIQKSIHVSE